VALDTGKHRAGPGPKGFGTMARMVIDSNELGKAQTLQRQSGAIVGLTENTNQTHGLNARQGF